MKTISIKIKMEDIKMISKITDLEFRIFADLCYYIPKDLKPPINLKYQYPFKTNFLNTLKSVDSPIANKTNQILKEWKLIDSTYILYTNELMKERQLANRNMQHHNIKMYSKIKDVNMVAFVFQKQDQILISFRGSNFKNRMDRMKDILENLKNINPSTLFALWEQSQSRYAHTFYTNVLNRNPKCQVSLTGHSKGGTLVQKIVDFEFKNKRKPPQSVTFNAFGVGLESSLKPFCKSFLIKGDITGMLRPHKGETITFGSYKRVPHLYKYHSLYNFDSYFDYVGTLHSK